VPIGKPERILLLRRGQRSAAASSRNTQYGTRSPIILSIRAEKLNTKKHEKTHALLSPAIHEIDNVAESFPIRRLFVTKAVLNCPRAVRRRFVASNDQFLDSASRPQAAPRRQALGFTPA
jgi:hypothetical protein